MLCASTCVFFVRARTEAGESPHRRGVVGAPQIDRCGSRKKPTFTRSTGLRSKRSMFRAVPWLCRRCFPAGCRSFSSAARRRCRPTWLAPTTVIVATILKKFLFSIFSRPDITRMADLKGQALRRTRFGTLSDSPRVSLWRDGLNPERDITMAQTGGRPGTVVALLTGKVQAAALSVPATMRARKRICASFSIWHTRGDDPPERRGVDPKYLKSNEDTGSAFFEGLHRRRALAKKDKAFATASWVIPAPTVGFDDATARHSLTSRSRRIQRGGSFRLARNLEKTQPQPEPQSRKISSTRAWSASWPRAVPIDRL